MSFKRPETFTISNGTKAVVNDLIYEGIRDYIGARFFYFSNFINQFYWSASQAMEKYLKAITLGHGFKIKRGNHRISPLYEHAASCVSLPKLSTDLKKYFSHIDNMVDSGNNRYGISESYLFHHIENGQAVFPVQALDKIMAIFSLYAHHMYFKPHDPQFGCPSIPHSNCCGCIGMRDSISNDLKYMIDSGNKRAIERHLQGLFYLSIDNPYVTDDIKETVESTTGYESIRHFFNIRYFTSSRRPYLTQTVTDIISLIPSQIKNIVTTHCNKFFDDLSLLPDTPFGGYTLNLTEDEQADLKRCFNMASEIVDTMEAMDTRKDTIKLFTSIRDKLGSLI